MSPGLPILNPRGNLALGRKAALLLFRDIFLPIKSRLLNIRPTVLAETISPFLFRSTRILYLDQAGYCFLSFTVSETTSQGVIGCLTFFGRRDCSFKPTNPYRSNLFCQLRIVLRVLPNLLAVRETFLP